MHFKEWRIEIENKPCIITIQHGSFFKKYKITLNDIRIKPIETIPIEKGNRITFNIKNHLCNIIVTYNGKFDYDLFLDGASVQMNRHISLPGKWEPQKKGFFKYILDDLIGWLVVGALAILIGLFTGNFSYKRTSLIIDVVVISIVIYAIFKSARRR